MSDVGANEITVDNATINVGDLTASTVTGSGNTVMFYDNGGFSLTFSGSDNDDGRLRSEITAQDAIFSLQFS